MDIAKIAKAIAATGATIAATGTTVFATVPDGVEMPWYAWLGLGVFNALLGFAVVYLAPKNAAADER
ncbi:hypothetical protein E3C22_20980 [Jiella endophytica]|uniref:Uncharacterized protein n=1 Tax=Jiella endophytica TaxID=2558362 RepID=A0A4Y8RAB3_9HYPH|nr:hypothetical protein [Jiella endophytica]TFF18704.1 hypothetical protein E3C22_20980 [Jiella endophytica]